MKTYNIIELNKISSDLKYNRDTLEKVFRLAELLKLFNEHDELKGKYVLKGGTAINICLFDFPRLSVDIDFDYNLNSSIEEIEQTRKLHQKIINENVSINKYIVHSKSRFTHTLDSYLLLYTNATGNNDYIKLELNYSNRVHILEPKTYDVASKIVDNVSVLGMDKIELYGSKIAALIGRTTARDIFDVSEMIRHGVIKEEEMDILRKSSIFYVMLSNEFQGFNNLISQFNINIEKIDFMNIKKNLIPMLKVGTKIELNSFKKLVVEFINQLFILEKDEQKFIDLYNNGQFEPSLIFDEKIANKLIRHPMIIWKMMNFKKQQNI